MACFVVTIFCRWIHEFTNIELDQSKDLNNKLYPASHVFLIFSQGLNIKIYPLYFDVFWDSPYQTFILHPFIWTLYLYYLQNLKECLKNSTLNSSFIQIFQTKIETGFQFNYCRNLGSLFMSLVIFLFNSV